MFVRTLPFALLLTACTPQNAVLTSGEYFAFMSEDTSFSLQKGVVDPYKWGDDMWTIDCREFVDKKSKSALQLTGIDIECEAGSGDEKCKDRRLSKICNDWLPLPPDEDGLVQVRPEHETWLAQSPWWVMHETLDPWRGEAIITAEGDLQIGFHHRLPGGEDFRFQFVVDPGFAPKQCDATTGKPIQRDGDWVASWTEDFYKQHKDEEGFEHLSKYETGSLFYLSADGFQFNPAQTGDYWFMPEQWEAGFAAGKFSEESFNSRPPRWGTNEVYEYFEVFDPSEGYFNPPSKNDLYYCELEEGEKPKDNTCVQALEEELDGIVRSIRKDTSSAIGVVEGTTWSPTYTANLWRPADGLVSGFDGWGELHYNYVAFDKTPEEMAKIAPGDSFNGAFTMVLDGLDSNSRWLVRGEFEVPKLKMDKWITEDIRARKLEENGNTLCVLE